MRKSILTLAAAAAVLAGAAHAETATYAMDPAHTFVTFEIGHFGTSTNRGRFDKKEGSVQLNRAAKTGKVEVSIDTMSVNTGTAAFDKHLQSADLFDAAKYPTCWRTLMADHSASRSSSQARLTGDAGRQSGRTTQLTNGRITAVGVTIKYGGGRVARLANQIAVRSPSGNFSAGGDLIVHKCECAYCLTASTWITRRTFFGKPQSMP